MDADGANQRRITDRAVGSPSFSPDGTSILADGVDGTIFTVDVATGETTPIALPTGTFGYEARWSPDGSWLVFALFTGKDPQPDLYAMRADGSGLTRLTDTPGVLDEAADWSPR